MIFSFIGQPDLRLVSQLLNMAATVINTTKTKNNFFIILLLRLKHPIIATGIFGKGNLRMVNGEMQYILPSPSNILRN